MTEESIELKEYSKVNKKTSSTMEETMDSIEDDLQITSLNQTDEELEEEENQSNDKDDKEIEMKDLDKKKKAKQQKKVKKKRLIRYPTQFLYVGDIKCIFLSCWNRGRSPVLSLGPSWPFTICLLTFAGVILCYFEFMIHMAKTANPFFKGGVQFMVCFNLFVLFAGILMNPGIPQVVIDRILKEQMGKGEEDDDVDEEHDLESGGNRNKKQQIRPPSDPRAAWCNDCKIEMKQDMYHCEDCLVCIEDYDHHCVFFSKCIGGGNLKAFWGSMALLLVNFVLIICLVISDSSSLNDAGFGPKRRPKGGIANALANQEGMLPQGIEGVAIDAAVQAGTEVGKRLLSSVSGLLN